MKNYDIEDDLGVPHGTAQLPHAGEARREVSHWHIENVGHRPKDYMARDMLFGSLQRDRRMWLYRRLAKNRPSWMTCDTLEFPDPDRKAIVQYRILHYLTGCLASHRLIRQTTAAVIVGVNRPYAIQNHVESEFIRAS